VIYKTAGHQPLLSNDPEKWRKEIESFLKN
jgi:hypothetical protein